MRYQDWDVLVFPEDCKVPLQEFRTACQVIQDPESSIYSQNGQMLLPTVTSFIPGLRAGSSFRISIHCWKDPDMSAYLQSITKHAENAIFEARLLIDGKLIGSKFYGRAGPWPSVIETSVELNKHGEFEPLKFPEFHHEVLTQPIWNAGDDIGRIKLIIAEGFPRDSISVPFERVRNLVAFSFQHAPLEVLENCNIAWPNAAMWRQVSIAAPYIARQPPPRNASEGGGIEAHSHSPRRRVPSAKRMTSLQAPVPHNQPVGSMAPPRPAIFDPFISPEHYWRQSSSSGDVSMRQASSSVGHDISMPDVSKSNTRTNSSRQVTNPIVTDHPDRRFETLQSVGAFESVCEALMMPFVPTNTPLKATTADGIPVPTNQTGNAPTKRPAELNSGVKAAFESETNVTLEAAASWSPSVKSKKENAHGQDHNPIEEVPRKVAQPFTKTTTSGSKRQRNVTPVAAKVIDDQDEPGPASRKVSRGAETGGKESERRVLSGIVNV